MPALRECFEHLALFCAIWALQRPDCEVFVCVEQVLSVQVLDEAVNPALVDPCRVVLPEYDEHFWVCRRAALEALGLSDRPQNSRLDEPRNVDYRICLDFSVLLSPTSISHCLLLS